RRRALGGLLAAGRGARRPGGASHTGARVRAWGRTRAGGDATGGGDHYAAGPGSRHTGRRHHAARRGRYPAGRRRGAAGRGQHDQDGADAMTTPAGYGFPDGAGTAAAVASPALLEVREITKHFPAGRRGAVVHAVDGVSLTLPGGS